MNVQDENTAALVRSQSASLSETGATSLVRRGVQDLAAKAEAERWYKQGQTLWDEKQYGEAVRCFHLGLKLSASYPDLQFALGLASWCGLGVPKDRHQAADWFRMAAEQGHADAANRSEERRVGKAGRC